MRLGIMLSIVIITCNRINTVTKSILSCKEHCSIEWELVVVDNGSTDGTRERIEELCKTEGIQLNYHYSETNLGVDGARNIGYEMARGDILYFIDDDAFIISEGYCLDDAYRYLKYNNNVQAMSTKIWDELFNGFLPEITANGAPMKTGIQLRSFIGCSHFLKKDGVLTSPIYPGNLFYGGEEIYLSYKIFKFGKKVEYYDKVLVEHHPSKNTRTSKYEIYRNRVVNWYVVKRYCYPQPYLFLSSMVFLYRIIKLTKGSPTKLKEIYRLEKERYERKNQVKLTIAEMRKMNNLFGCRYLI